MSIATELNNLKTHLASAYTKAGEKGATLPANKNMQNLASTIDTITTGGGASDAKINFYDCYGALSQSVSVDELPLSALPTITPVDGYTIAWSKTLAEVNAMTDGGNVVADVTADTDTTWVYPSDIGFQDVTYTMRIGKNGRFSSTVEIDWGDGSAIDTVSVSSNVAKTHTFAAISHNPIKLTVTGSNAVCLGDGGRSFGGDSSEGVNLLKQTKRIHMGKKVLLSDSCFCVFAFYHEPETIKAGIGVCALEEIIIPNTISSIPGSAFNFCHNLKYVNISNVTVISNNMFSSCWLLENVVSINDITYISENSFRDCMSLKNIDISGATTIYGNAFEFCGLENINFANNVVIQGDFSVQGCSNLKSIKIPNNVTHIADDCFSGCNFLESITFPDNPINIGNMYWRDSYSLKEFNIPSGSTITLNQYAPVYNFSKCYNLESIAFPANTTFIGENASFGCPSCRNLKTVTIPDNVTEIGYMAFEGCNKLESIIIPNSVTNIESYAFNDNRSLKYIKMESSTPPTSEDDVNHMLGYNGFCIIYIPSGSLSAYLADPNWATCDERFVEYTIEED